MLKNPVVRVMIASAVAVYVVPAINNAFIKPALTPGQEVANDIEIAGIFGAVTAGLFVIASMMLGAPAAVPS